MKVLARIGWTEIAKMYRSCRNVAMKFTGVARMRLFKERSRIEVIEVV